MPRSASPKGSRRERSPAHKDKDRDRRERERSERDKPRDRARSKEANAGRDKDSDSKRRREDSRERERDAKRSRRSRSRSYERTHEKSRDPVRRPDDKDRPSGRDRDAARDSGRNAGRERDGRDSGRSRETERRNDGGGSREHGGERGPSRRPEENGRSHDESKQNGSTLEPGEVLPPPPKPAKKAEPLSLEELIKKREAEQLAASKPVFLTKKQREELALKRRQEEVAAVKAPAAPDTARTEQQVAQDRRREEDRRRDDDRRRRDENREREKELQMIKAQYLGGEKKKKKVLKGAEKFKFNFDWEAGDDTSRDLNPLYNTTHEAALLFGRGLRAGVDRREQKKTAAGHEAQLLRKVREAAGVKETKEDRQRDRNRKAMAEGYDKTAMKTGSHWSEKSRDAMTERDWRIFREDFNISYKGASHDKSTLPIRNWEEAGLPSVVMKAVKAMKYEKPSPIQMAAIPLGMKFRDVIGVAETGSGKTAAFVLPMLTYIMSQPKMTEEVAAEGPYAVIMAPTRELAQQIEEESLKMAQFTEFRFVCVVGGQSIEDQGFKLRKGCEVIIATPGRLIDCLEQRYAVLNQCNYIVLDEADRMIDLGFEPQVIGVMDAMPATHLKPEGEDVALEENRVYRTTYMFSATMPPAVERLARKYLRRPVVINIGSAGKAVDLITQRVQVVKENEKPHLLESELSYVGDQRVVVFVNTQRQCDVVANVLYDRGFSCTILHGGKSQDQREEGLAGFREKKYTVLVATDVAGRGIDVPDIALVVNYDMPNTIEAYTHRIGRTGRAGRKGAAVTFLTLGSQDQEVFFDLKKFLEDSKATVPPQLASHEAAKAKPGGPDARPRRDQTVFAKH